MSILSRITGRRPAVAQNLATPRPGAQPGDKPPTGEGLGEYGGPTSGSAVQRWNREYGSLVNLSKLTPRLIEKMREHPQVTAALAVQSLPLLRADWTIDCDDPDIADVVTGLYEAIHPRVARSAARALWAGYSPNVLVWDVDPETGALTVVGVRDLDPATCTPKLDDLGDYDGFVQRSPSGGRPIPIDPLQSLWIVEGLESGNLFGRSLLTAARQPWQDQQTVNLYHLRYLERFGEPVVVVRAPSGIVDANEAARIDAETWNAANPTETPRPVPESRWVTKLDVARELGENLRHHSTVSLPSEVHQTPEGKSLGFAWALDYLSAGTADGSAFADKLEALDRQIARGMLVPSLLIEGGDTVGSNALGQSHRDAFTQNVDARLADYAGQITQHLIDRLVRFNFGDRAPAARLVFAPTADETLEQMWQLMARLVDGKGVALDGPAIAARLGVPVLVAGEDDEVDPVAASPFASVGLPALIAAGVISPDEARTLIGLEGPAPEAPVVEAAFAAHRAGSDLLARTILGLRDAAPAAPAPRVHASRRDEVTLAVAPADVDGLPDWRKPAAVDPQPWRRELTARERRVDMRRVEDELNAAEAATIDQLVRLLEVSHEKVARQVNGIMRKGGSVADVVTALDGVDVGPVAPWASAWADLQRSVWGSGLESVRRELERFAEAVPGAIGRDGLALVKSYAQASADRTLADLSTRVRLELLASFRSGVSPAGMMATVSSVYDRVIRGEGQPPRLTTRMLSAKALNEGRADAIARGGIPLAGAQFSAILDTRTCELCGRLDEQLIGIADLDFTKFTPPLHHNCRCVWVYVTTDEADFAPNWTGAPRSMVDAYGGLVFG